MLIAGRDACQKFYTAVNEEGGCSSTSLHHIVLSKVNYPDKNPTTTITDK